MLGEAASTEFFLTSSEWHDEDAWPSRWPLQCIFLRVPLCFGTYCGDFFPGLYLALYYHTIVLGSLVINESITQKPFEFFCVAAFKKGPSIYPQCRKDVSNLSFAFYIFPLPAGVSLADDQVGGHRKLGAKNVGTWGRPRRGTSAVKLHLQKVMLNFHVYLKLRRYTVYDHISLDLQECLALRVFSRYCTLSLS